MACTPAGRIGSASRTAPGRTHDLAVLRHDGVLDRLPAGAGMVADKATRNRPRADDQRAADRGVSRHWVAAEHVMAQPSRFQVLRQSSRGVLGRHTQAFRAVARAGGPAGGGYPLAAYPAAA